MGEFEDGLLAAARLEIGDFSFGQANLQSRHRR